MYAPSNFKTWKEFQNWLTENNLYHRYTDKSKGEIYAEGNPNPLFTFEYDYEDTFDEEPIEISKIYYGSW
jgi:hypothetical protein